MNELEKLRKTLDDLIESIEKRKESKKELNAFLNAIEDAWETYQAKKIHSNVKAVPRSMYLYAIKELPQKIENNEYDTTLTELRQFKNTMEKVVEPSYED